MSTKPAMTPTEAQKFLADHDLGFLDVCSMVLAFAARTNGMLKFSTDRCVVHIKSARKKRGAKP